MRVFDRLAEPGEQAEPGVERRALAAAEGGQRLAFDPLHQEERAPVLGLARPEHRRDAGVVERGKRLPLRLEPRRRLPAEQARLEDLQRGEPAATAHAIDEAAAAFAGQREHLVAADPIRGFPRTEQGVIAAEQAVREARGAKPGR